MFGGLQAGPLRPTCDFQDAELFGFLGFGVLLEAEGRLATLSLRYHASREVCYNYNLRDLLDVAGGGGGGVPIGVRCRWLP